MVEPVFDGAALDRTKSAARSNAALTMDVGRFCATCHHVGYVFIEDLSEFTEGGWFRKRPCSCNTDTPEILSALRAAGIPDLYLGASVSSWTNTGRTTAEKAQNGAVLGAVKRIVERMEEASKDGLGIWLSGPEGTGKTWLACGVLREAMVRWRFDGAFSSGSSLVRLSIEEPERLAELRAVRWLVIDGIDQIPKTQSGYDLTLVADLIRERYHGMRPTIFTAARSLKDSREDFIESIRSILTHYTLDLALTGGNFSDRRSIGAKWGAA